MTRVITQPNYNIGNTRFSVPTHHRFSFGNTAPFSTGNVDLAAFYIVNGQFQQIEGIRTPIHFLLEIWLACDPFTDDICHTISQGFAIFLRTLIVNNLYQQIAEHRHQDDKDDESCVYTQKYTVFKHL